MRIRIANRLRSWAHRLDSAPWVDTTPEGWDIYLGNGQKLAHIGQGSW